MPRGRTAPERVPGSWPSLGRLLAFEIRNRINPLEEALRRLCFERAADPQLETRIAIRHLEGLIDRLLNAADRVGRPAAPMALGELVSEVLAVHGRRAEAAGVELRTTGPLPASSVDAERTRLVLSLLIDNAVRHADPAKPERWVRVDARPLDEATPRLLRIEVVDNGTGIPEPQREQLARASLRDRDAPATAGLGLAIAHLAVEQMGGTLGLASRDGGGTTVLFTLREVPRAARDAELPFVERRLPADRRSSTSPLPIAIDPSIGRDAEHEAASEQAKSPDPARAGLVARQQ